ncbi:MAG TPA: ABC transporter substrate-binding protein [Dehalococcoidia bacterium]|nr:ABC transporter substrate-binding protein [Dehalococcoidia bacterium]
MTLDWLKQSRFPWRLALVLLSVVALMGLVAACGDDDDDDDGGDSPTAAATTTSAGEPTDGPSLEGSEIDLLIGVDTPDYTNLIEYAAQDILAEQGITLNIGFSGDGETGVQQVIQGNAHIVDLPIVGFVPAITQGAEIEMVLSTARQSFAYASNPSITSIDDLANRTVAVHSEVSFTKAVTDALIEKYDIQGTTELIIPGSDVRLQTLVEGQIDATTVDLGDLIRAQQQFPGEINVLGTVAEEFPGLVYVVVGWDTGWADENPELAQAFVNAMIEADTRLEDLDYALEIAQVMLPDEEAEIQELIVTEFVDADINNSSDLNEETALETMQFFYDFGSIETNPATINVEDYFDFTWQENAQ